MSGGMTDGFENELQTMHAVANQFHEVQRQLQHRFTLLRNDMLAAKAGWQGDAGTAFQDLMAKYDETARKLNQALDNIAQNLDADHDEYGDDQVRTSQVLSDIQKALA